MNAASSRLRWLVVVGSTLALTVSNGPVLLFTFGVLLKPVAQAFGWSRGIMSIGLTAGLILGGLATPCVGMLIDRWGIRRVTLVSITLFAASFALLSLTPHNVAIFCALYATAGLLSCGQAPLPYAKAISGWFEEQRGLALGIAMAGIGLGIAVVPQVAHALVTSAGWRDTFAVLGAATWLIAFPAVLFLVSDPEPGAAAAGVTAPRPQTGEAVASVVRGREFWLILIASFLVALAINGIAAHLEALVLDKGVPANVAATLLAVMGLATIVGRLLSGYLLDRVFAPYLAASIFLLPVIGIAVVLASTTSPLILRCAAACFGMSLGAEVDIIGFLIGRYFGLLRYGQIYGYIFAAFTIGSGLGPFLMGLSFDTTGDYKAALVAFIGALLAACWLISRLGTYRYPARNVAALAA